jgi:hypothetical protein
MSSRANLARLFLSLGKFQVDVGPSCPDVADLAWASD